MDDLKLKAQRILAKMPLDTKHQEARELEAEAGKPEFWLDNQTATAKMKRLAALQEEIKKLDQLEEYDPAR